MVAWPKLGTPNKLAAQISIFTALRKSETSPLFVPIERQSHVIEELARRQVGRCFPLRIALTISGANSVRRNSRVA